MLRFPITKAGLDRLEREVKHLKYVQRPNVTALIATAKAFGDLSENAEYHAAREKQSFIEGKIKDLEDKIARAEVIDITKLSGHNIKFGSAVTLKDDDTDETVQYHIVGEYEADINFKRVSISSPIAKALIGRKVGEDIEFSTPKGGKKSYEITAMSFVEVIFEDEAE